MNGRRQRSSFIAEQSNHWKNVRDTGASFGLNSRYNKKRRLLLQGTGIAKGRIAVFTGITLFIRNSFLLAMVQDER